MTDFFLTFLKDFEQHLQTLSVKQTNNITRNRDIMMNSDIKLKTNYNDSFSIFSLFHLGKSFPTSVIFILLDEVIDFHHNVNTICSSKAFCLIFLDNN